MTKGTLAALVLRNFPHEPTPQQAEAARSLSAFLTGEEARSCFLLTGYAGTGKTSLLGALVRALRELETPCVLLAPTGRAAKVFSLYSGSSASTIHRCIYRQKGLSPDAANFVPGFNRKRHALFIVDEASMIANEGLSGGLFGSGRLLDDLVDFVYSGPGCRLMLVGDTAQLPPVGEELSPALNPGKLRAYGLSVETASLTEVVRQAEQSGILWNATSLRRLLQEGQSAGFPSIRARGFADVRLTPGSELIEALEDSYYQCGADQTIVVTRSNKRANIYNNGIRARILDHQEELVSGDQLIVAKNNYYWTERLRERSMEFIANGDVARVLRVWNERELYGFRFCDATVSFPDYDDCEMTLTLLLDTLQAEAPALPRERQQQLFDNVWADYAETKSRRKQMQKIKEDPYYNALQVKFAYAVTCHKAQGGQWQHVYIDQGYVSPEMLTPEYLRWLYTAFTRATERIYLVNWPKAQTEAEGDLAE
ncbi:MAG: AAA family ATPase [Prevotellaceae bacterium]|nr:AAA family ATPase [Prevotellaceae bacterium]